MGMKVPTDKEKGGRRTGRMNAPENCSNGECMKRYFFQNSIEHVTNEILKKKIVFLRVKKICSSTF